MNTDPKHCIKLILNKATCEQGVRGQEGGGRVQSQEGRGEQVARMRRLLHKRYGIIKNKTKPYR